MVGGEHDRHAALRIVIPVDGGTMERLGNCLNDVTFDSVLAIDV